MGPRPAQLPEGTSREEVVARLAAAFGEHRVPAVLLRAPGVDAGQAGNVGEGNWRHDLDVMVPWGAREATDQAMETLEWRVAIGGLGPWARVPTVSYYWDYAPSLDVHRGLPMGPLPPGSLRRLERALVSSARPTPCGLAVPDAAPLALFAATQAARPGSYRELWLGDVAAHVAAAGRAEAMAMASSLGLGRLLTWALDPTAKALPRNQGGPLFDGARRGGWRGALWLRRRLRPRRFGAFLGGIPRVGDTVVRSRFAGLELRAGPGAFTPQPVSEPMVRLALEGLSPAGPATVVDVGTGVGAVALAIAEARPDAEVHGCDLSEQGLRWAERNRERLGIRNARFHRGSLLEPLDVGLFERVDVITANVPYVPSHVFGEDFLDREGAVLGQGDDGLGLQRELLRQSIMFLAPQGRLVVQMSIDQWELFAPEMASWGFAPQPMAASSFEDAICWGIADGGRE